MLGKLRTGLFIGFVLLIITGCSSGGGDPVVVIDSPPSGTGVMPGETVEVQATGSDPNGDGITRIVLQANGSPVANSEAPSGAQASYSTLLAWTPTEMGTVTLTAIAYRADGTTSEPASITINVNEDGTDSVPPAEEGEAEAPADEGAAPAPDSDGGAAPSGGNTTGSATTGNSGTGSTTGDSSTSTDSSGSTNTEQDSSGSTDSSTPDSDSSDDDSTTGDSSNDTDQSGEDSSSDSPTPTAVTPTPGSDTGSTGTATPTPTPSYTPTTEPAPQLAPEDARFNNPLSIPLDTTTSVLDFVSYSGGDTVDMVRYEVTGMNNNVSITGGQANLTIQASCFGEGTEFIEFFTGGQTYGCGSIIVDRTVTADSDTGTITITATGGSGTYVQWVLTGTAVRTN